jgi:hypothetical protein
MFEFDLGQALGTSYQTALSLGADESYITARTEDSTSGNAVQSMQPISQPTVDDGFGWLKDLVKTGVGYAIAKDAQQNSVAPPQVYAATAAQAQGQQVQRAQSSNLLVLLLVAGVVVFALKD